MALAHYKETCSGRTKIRDQDPEGMAIKLKVLTSGLH
jgi:hypothetical protein